MCNCFNLPIPFGIFFRGVPLILRCRKFTRLYMPLGSIVSFEQPSNIKVCRLHKLHNDSGNILTELQERSKYRRLIKSPRLLGNIVSSKHPSNLKVCRLRKLHNDSGNIITSLEERSK
ncbi:hypothetical protein AAHE18_02G022800 [Arachis hypogaea]